MQHIGIDLGKTSSQVCALLEDGELMEKRIKTGRETLTRLFGGCAPARILLEASTESEWVARTLEALGHEVVVADPNFSPMYATRSKRVKTDRRDARALAEACRLGAYRPAHRASDKQRRTKNLLAVREALVRTRARYICVGKSLLRAEGLRLESRDAARFATHLAQLALPEGLRATIAPLAAMVEGLNAEIARSDAALGELMRTEAVVRRLCTVPGVGPVTAVSFVATLDEASRFASAKQVRAYLGLVPSEYSSGEQQRRGRLTKAGNSRMRYLLVEAAWALLRDKSAGTEGLRAWVGDIARRRGRRVAAVALARKLAGIMYALWRDETEFAGKGRSGGERSARAA
jgi:transposase